MSKIRVVEKDREDEKPDMMYIQLQMIHICLRITLDGDHARYGVCMHPTLMCRALITAFKRLVAKLAFIGLCNMGIRRILG
jgi:hypothetical protein